MKVAALGCLGKLNAKSVISNIADCLSDSEWWVRITAGQVLKSMGDDGIRILNEQTPAKDKFAYDVAQSLLKKE